MIRKFWILAPGVLCWMATAHAMDLTTVEGRTYRNATVQRADPDGLIVAFQPDQAGGFGVAKVKFRDLPENVRSQYNYDANKANDFEAQQARATAEWRARPAREGWFERYRQVAELNRALAGDSHVSYMVSVDPAGKISLQGFTGTVMPYSWCFPGTVPFNYYGPGPEGPAPAPEPPNAVRPTPQPER